MANLNKVMLLGRLTRDPEPHTFSNGGKVTKFGFVVENRKKNQQSGQWESDPVWLEVSAFNRGETGKTADFIEKYLTKGSLAFIEGHLDLQQWDDKKSGEKRSKLVIICDNIQSLDQKQKVADTPRQERASTPAPQPSHEDVENSIPF